jgi:hypothetical protein
VPGWVLWCTAPAVCAHHTATLYGHSFAVAAVWAVSCSVGCTTEVTATVAVAVAVAAV